VDPAGDASNTPIVPSTPVKPTGPSTPAESSAGSGCSVARARPANRNGLAFATLCLLVLGGGYLTSSYFTFALWCSVFEISFSAPFLGLFQ
jgi:hypothetical protein